jgi:hypothetical protein
MDLRAEWHSLAKNFTDLLQNGRLLLTAYPEWNDIEGWRRTRPRSEDDEEYVGEVLARFRALAERGAVLSGQPPGEAALYDWLDTLKHESSSSKISKLSRTEASEPVLITQVVPLCEASIEVCYKFETRAMSVSLRLSRERAREQVQNAAPLAGSSDNTADALDCKGEPRRRSRSPTFPQRAEWLKKRLRERSWNKHDLERQGGPHHKTTQKILNGMRVREEVLPRVATGLSAYWGRIDGKVADVNLLDIPNE